MVSSIRHLFDLDGNCCVTFSIMQMVRQVKTANKKKWRLSYYKRFYSFLMTITHSKTIKISVSKTPIYILFLLIVFTNAFSRQKQERNFKYQLNHIGICVDSITFQSLISNKFISDTLFFTKVVKDSTGSEILLLGKEHYLQFYPEKGFFKNRLGACVLYHHSFTWKETDLHLAYLQSFTKDSLYNRPYLSKELNIGYINVYENLADSSRLLKFIPVLQNASKENYLSWGHTTDELVNGISQKKYMSDYVGKETSNKLFKSIHSIIVTASSGEQKRISPLMKGYGYKRRGNKFSLIGSPVVTITTLKRNTHAITIRMKLEQPVQKRVIHVSENGMWVINGYDAWFHYFAREH